MQKPWARILCDITTYGVATGSALASLGWYLIDASSLVNKSYLINPPRLVVRVKLESTIEVADNPTNIKALHPSITIIQDMPPGLGSHPYDAHCKCGSSFVG